MIIRLIADGRSICALREMLNGWSTFLAHASLIHKPQNLQQPIAETSSAAIGCGRTQLLTDSPDS
jgi:hypothetical protein